MGERSIDFERDVPDDDPKLKALLKCPSCGHEHTDRRLGFICIGCPCEKRPPFTKLAL